MAVKLCKRNLPELLSWLNQHLPYSYKIHGELRSHLRGQFPDLEFFVDRWPRPQAALARVDPDGQQLSCKAFFRHSVEGLYGLSEEALSKLLTDPTAVDWNTRTHFFSMSASLQPVMQTIAQRMGRRVHFDHNLLVKHCPRLVPALPVPEGMVCRPIRSAADIDIANRTWKYGNEDSTAFIHHLVHQYPSSYLGTEQGQHIGNRMAVKLCKRNLPELLSWLNQHLPYSYKIHGELRSHLRGQFPDLEFFVDRWPRPQAALARVDPDGQQELRIHYSEHKTNEYVRQRIDTLAGKQEPLLSVVKRRKLTWFGHVNRHDSLAKTILQGTVGGGRRRG
ncbi:hypothetical protein ACOMHN_045350 [Nucella lapillus]